MKKLYVILTSLLLSNAVSASELMNADMIKAALPKMAVAGAAYFAANKIISYCDTKIGYGKQLNGAVNFIENFVATGGSATHYIKNDGHAIEINYDPNKNNQITAKFSPKTGQTEELRFTLPQHFKSSFVIQANKIIPASYLTRIKTIASLAAGCFAWFAYPSMMQFGKNILSNYLK